MERGESTPTSPPTHLFFCLAPRSHSISSAKMAAVESEMARELPLVSFHFPYSNPVFESLVNSASRDTFELLRMPISEITDDDRKRIQGFLSYPLGSRIDGQVMDLFPSLRVISNVGAGVNNIDLTAASDRGIVVGNTAHVLSNCSADMGFALLLASARNVVQGDRIAKSRDTVRVRTLLSKLNWGLE